MPPAPLQRSIISFDPLESLIQRSEPLPKYIFKNRQEAASARTGSGKARRESGAGSARLSLSRASPRQGLCENERRAACALRRRSARGDHAACRSRARNRARLTSPVLNHSGDRGQYGSTGTARNEVGDDTTNVQTG